MNNWLIDREYILPIATAIVLVHVGLFAVRIAYLTFKDSRKRSKRRR